MISDKTVIFVALVSLTVACIYNTSALRKERKLRANVDMLMAEKYQNIHDDLRQPHLIRKGFWGGTDAEYASVYNCPPFGPTMQIRTSYGKDKKVIAFYIGQEGSPRLQLIKGDEVRDFDLWEVSERWQ